jgi:hypothetical protein
MWGSLDEPSGRWGFSPLPFDSGVAETEQPVIAASPDGELHAVGVDDVPRRGEPRTTFFAYANLDSAPATAVPIPATAEVLYRPSTRLRVVAVSSGYVHVGVLDLAGSELATRSQDGETWNVRAIDSPIFDMAERPDGRLEVVRSQPPGANRDRTILRHVRLQDGAWPRDEETLPLPPAGWQMIRLAVDPESGVSHVMARAPDAMVYLRREDDRWSQVELERIPTRSEGPALALDPVGTPWIAYRDEDADLVVARPPPSGRGGRRRP